MHRIALWLVVTAGAAGAVSCGSSTQTVTSPSTVKCSVNVSATPTSFAAAGGAGTVSVSTNRDCQWSPFAAAPWIQLADSSPQQGSGTVAFTIAANADPTTRKSAITVTDQQIGITQDAASCVFTVDPSRDSVSSKGGQGTIAITASSAQCRWTARSDADWLAIASDAQGSGSGRVTYQARETSGPPRTGTLVVAGQVVTVTQSGGCSYAVDPVAQSVGAAGGAGVVNVHAAAGCEWRAVSNVPWITLTSGASGAGEGSAQFTVAASTGPGRSGTLTVAGQTVTLAQASGCTYALAPGAQDISAAGGAGSFAVNTSPGCGWSAASRADWIALTGPTSGSGPGTVSFAVGFVPMGGPPRSGAIAVNDRTFTLNQAAGAPCTYTLSSNSQDFSAAGGTGSFAVSTVLTCPWSASSNAPWITITSYPAGAGNGGVSFSVAANPPGSPPRVGTIDVRGPTFTIRQGAADNQ